MSEHPEEAEAESGPARAEPDALKPGRCWPCMLSRWLERALARAEEWQLAKAPGVAASYRAKALHLEIELSNAGKCTCGADHAATSATE